MVQILLMGYSLPQNHSYSQFCLMLVIRAVWDIRSTASQEKWVSALQTKKRDFRLQHKNSNKGSICICLCVTRITEFPEYLQISEQTNADKIKGYYNTIQLLSLFKRLLFKFITLAHILSTTNLNLP